MNLNKPVIAIALSIASLFTAVAQSEIEATPTPEPSPTPSPSRPQASFVRVWYFGSPESPRVTIAVSGESTNRRALVSHFRPGRLGNYRLVRPGSSKLILVDGNVVPDEAGRLPAAEPLVPPVASNFEAGSYYTILVQNNSGNYTFEFLEDKKPKGDLGPAVRVLNLVSKSKFEMFLHSESKSEKVWSSETGGTSSSFSPALLGPVRFALREVGSLNGREISSYEAAINKGAGYSAVIHSDRSGEPTMTIVEDAQSGYTAEDLKQFAAEQ